MKGEKQKYWILYQITRKPEPKSETFCDSVCILIKPFGRPGDIKNIKRAETIFKENKAKELRANNDDFIDIGIIKTSLTEDECHKRAEELNNARDKATNAIKFLNKSQKQSDSNNKQ